MNFKETGVKVIPDTPLDSHMVRIQEAQCNLVINCFYFIQENVRDENWVHPYQLGALMDKDGHIGKLWKDLIPQPSDATDHFRDPQIFPI